MKVLSYVVLGTLLASVNIALASDKAAEDKAIKEKTQMATNQSHANESILAETQADEFTPVAKKYNPHEILNTKFLSRRPYMPAKYE